MEFNAEYNGTDNLVAVAELDIYNEYVYELVRHPIPNGARVLEFGAGIGEFAKRFCRDGVKIDCVEPEQAFVPVLQKYSVNVYPGISACDALYDCVVSINVLEHISDDSAALKSIYSVLKPGGDLILYLPAHPFLFSRMDKKVGHFRRYSAGDIILKLQRSGFVVVDKKMVDFLGLFVSLGYKFLPVGDGTLTAGGMRLYDLIISRPTKFLDRLFGWTLGRNICVVARK